MKQLICLVLTLHSANFSLSLLSENMKTVFLKYAFIFSNFQQNSCSTQLALEYYKPM